MTHRPSPHLFGEAPTDGIVERLGASPPAASSLLPHEIVSVVAGKAQRGEASTETAVIALEALAGLQIALHEPDAQEVLRFTIQTRLTAYDAAYLWLARDGCPP